MKTHRYFITLLLFAVMSLCFSACSSDDDDRWNKPSEEVTQLWRSPHSFYNPFL